MTREDMGEKAYEALLDSITAIMMRKGIKATTMDQIAATLQISKRTLYEIFNNKTELVSEVIRSFQTKQADMHKENARSSANEAEALLNIFLMAREMIAKMNVDFYRDMDQYYLVHEHKFTRDAQFHYMHNMVDLIKNGQEKGLFRKDMNYVLSFQMMVIQMESLKKMEETFPASIKLLEVYDVVMTGFMRGISTVKGLKIVDSLLDKHFARKARTLDQSK